VAFARKFEHGVQGEELRQRPQFYGFTRRPPALSRPHAAERRIASAAKSPGAIDRVACPAPLAKIFRFSEVANRVYILGHPEPTRGAFRDRHERWVRDAVDAGALCDELRSRGRRSRVVLTPRRWRQVPGKQFSGVTVARTPDHREEHEVSRKTIARGNVGSPPLPCMLVCVFCASCTRDRGCSAHPAFPAPSIFGGSDDFKKTRANRAARPRRCAVTALRGALATKQSSFLAIVVPAKVFGPGRLGQWNRCRKGCSLH